MSCSAKNKPVEIVEPNVEMSNRGAVLVLVYNETDYGKECIESLDKHLPNDVSVVLIDNGSDANLAKHFKKRYPWIHSLRNSENAGYAGGNNVGAKYAIQRGANKVYYLNDDTVVCPNFWEACERDMRQHNAGIVGSVILHYHNPERIQEAGKHWNLNTFRYITRGVDKNYDTIDKNFYDCDSVCGAGFMASADVIKETGGFEEDFFFFYEETDLCLRLKSCGVRIGISGESQILHKGSQTIGSINPMFSYYEVRNYGWLIRRHSSGVFSFMLGVLQVAKVMGHYLKEGVTTGKVRSVQATLKGIFDGIVGQVP